MHSDARSPEDQAARPLGGLTGKLCACGDEKQWATHKPSKHGASARCQWCEEADDE